MYDSDRERERVTGCLTHRTARRADLIMSPLHIFAPEKLLEGFVFQKGEDALVKHVTGVQGISMFFIGLVLFDAGYCGSAAGQKTVSRMALLAQLAGVAHEINTGMNADATPIYITFGVLLSCSVLGLLSASQAEAAGSKSKKK